MPTSRRWKRDNALFVNDAGHVVARVEQGTLPGKVVVIETAVAAKGESRQKGMKVSQPRETADGDSVRRIGVRTG